MRKRARTDSSAGTSTRTPSSSATQPLPAHLLASRDILDVISRYLDWQDVLNMTCVCRTWRQAGANLRALALLNDEHGLPRDNRGGSQRERFVAQLSRYRELVRSRCAPLTFTLAGAQGIIRCVSLAPSGETFFAGESKVCSFEGCTPSPSPFSFA